MKPEKIAYGGWDNCLRLTNGTVELIVTLDVGPRVIRLGFVDGPNLLKEFDEQMGKTIDGEWSSFGGHRLWHAPEVFPRTYYPDNDPVAHEWNGSTLKLTGVPEEGNGLQKEIEITLEKNGQVHLVHRLINRSPWDIECAPWCLSVMAPGGRVIVPQEQYIPHPDCLVPARALVLWHFTRMNDPRWTWGDRYFQLAEDSSIPSKQKAGAQNTEGWAAYALPGQLFIKRFPYLPGTTYPDMGCNCEFYTEPGFLEVETLGPLARIAPGEAAEHAERWAIFNADIGKDEETITHDLLPLVAQVPGV